MRKTTIIFLITFGYLWFPISFWLAAEMGFGSFTINSHCIGKCGE